MIDLCLIALPNPVLTTPTMYFPLGILYIAAVVKDAGFSVEIVDMRDKIKGVPLAKYYGFSCTTPEIKYAFEVAKVVTGKTIIGGAHATVAPRDCKNFDYIVSGEGEMPIIEILRGKVDTQLVMGNRVLNLDDIPYPAWDMVKDCFSEELFPGERYGKGEKGMTVISSRGCPYNCSFCANTTRTPVIYRSTKNIIGELKELKKRGVHYIRFEDDNFTLHPDLQNLLLDLAKLNIHWKCHTRSGLLSLEQAQMMKWAGCEECGIGVESADDIVLAINNKKIKAEQHGQAIELLHKAGIRAKTYFIAGLPGETKETLRINQEFFERYKPDKWTLSTFTPYPGCDIFHHPSSYGVTIEDWDYSHWWNFAKDGFVHSLAGQTREELWDRYQRFYAWLVGETWK